MIRPALTILFICLLFTSCNKPDIEEGKIVIQPDIVSNPVYTKLNKQQDIQEFAPFVIKPKTSDVSYVNNRNGSLTDTTYARFNNCKPYIKDGKLIILIGLSNGFTASGFDIKCDNSKFRIVPYYSTDLIIEGIETVSSYNIIQQQVILNKDKYILGDSIFGYVDFKLIENEKTIYKHEFPDKIEEQKITHIGKGYFRGKIEKRP